MHKLPDGVAVKALRHILDFVPSDHFFILAFCCIFRPAEAVYCVVECSGNALYGVSGVALYGNERIAVYAFDNSRVARQAVAAVALKKLIADLRLGEKPRLCRVILRPAHATCAVRSGKAQNILCLAPGNTPEAPRYKACTPFIAVLRRVPEFRLVELRLKHREVAPSGVILKAV